MDRLPQLGKRKLSFLLLFTFKYVVSVRGFLFPLLLGIGCLILLWHSLGLPYDYLAMYLPPEISHMGNTGNFPGWEILPNLEILGYI